MKNTLKITISLLTSVIHFVPISAESVSSFGGALLIEGQSLDGKYGVFSYSLSDEKLTNLFQYERAGNIIETNIQSPEWIPEENSNEFLFSGFNKETHKFYIGIHNLSNGQSNVVLSDVSTSYYGPVFSRSGSYIALNASKGEKNYLVVYSKDFIEKLSQVEIQHSKSGSYISWSQDDKYISIVSGKKVIVFSIEKNIVFSLGVKALQFSFSPNKSVGAFISEGRKISMIDIHSRQITETNIDNAYSIAWAPNGDFLVFSNPVDKGIVDWFIALFSGERTEDAYQISIADSEGRIIKKDITRFTKMEPRISWVDL